MSQYDTIEKQASYGIGRQMGDQLARQPFEGLDVTSIQQGLADALAGLEFAVDVDSINEAFQEIHQKMEAASAAKSEAIIAAGEEYLKSNAARENVVVTDSGLQYEILNQGDGQPVLKENTVKVHYHGTLIDGTVFDSSVDRNNPATFPVTGVIPGWVEALQLMKVGDKYRLTIPYQLAYGANGAGGAIPPYATLVFDVEVLGIAS